MQNPLTIFSRNLSYRNVSILFVVIALLCIPFADLSIYNVDPWQELRRFGVAILSPDIGDISILLNALLQTLSFALIGVFLGVVCAIPLSYLYRFSMIRGLCAFLRAIHELFWALIFLQVFGLHPLTGILALAIPYAATFAKVYAEIIEEADHSVIKALPSNTGRLNQFFYGLLPDVWQALKTYTSYRFECGLRSSVILGFIGLPTLGFYLESSFMQGDYSYVVVLLLVFYLLIASIRYWLRPLLMPVYFAIAAYTVLTDQHDFKWSNVHRFFTQDIIPSPIRGVKEGSVNDLWHWFSNIMQDQAIPGIINTLLLTQIALVVTGILTLMVYPLISKHFQNRLGQGFGHVALVIMRSTPEYILAFILLQFFGPSMLPAVIALALHNAGIIGHLVGNQSNTLDIRIDAPKGLNLYAYELTPRIYGNFLAYLFYRWEIILRETAIMGLLGIATLGFYIDNAMQDLRFDRALLLILITALLNMSVDAISRLLRRKSTNTPKQRSNRILVD
ncbi:phosphonate ABC transporter, permease protein PhnE [Cocleimonas flava]|uniref:Phosphonate transport system permease protein n=1 Tax=Cocleimonas flava TaxID=634765 RepID=A0A4R1F1G7_9GAMM|nr:phosphonate transport system permease protein [Cocleimonas flava]